MKYFIFLFLFLLMPIALADSCSITNLGNCLPEAFFNYILDLINTPLEWLLGFVQSLLTEPVDASVYDEIWAIVVYILSMFYGLLLVYSGITFMISGYDVAKRESAKESLKNILIMIFLVQASYFIYVLILDINSALTTSVYNLIDSDFFIFSIDHFGDIASQIMFGSSYLIVLLVTIIILSIRYLILSFGVALFPIAIFFYFIEPLKGMGKSLLYFLGINIFMSFIASIILLFGSMLLETSLFTDGKEYVIKKIVATWKDEKGSLFIIPPCGSCRQMMRETDPKNLETEVILDKNKVIKLKELLPYWDWWKKQ